MMPDLHSFMDAARFDARVARRAYLARLGWRAWSVTWCVLTVASLGPVLAACWPMLTH